MNIQNNPDQLTEMPVISYNLELKDETLMMRIVNGDPEASDLLVNRYKNILFSFIYRLIENQSDAEDLFQETWLRVIRYRQTFKPDKKFSTWLFQIALNRTRDFLTQKDPAVTLEEDAAPAFYSTEYQHTDDQDTAQKIIHSLPLPQREVLVLKYYNDMKEEEIAEVLGIPLGTVKSRVHNAIKSIKMAYGERV